MGNFPSQYYGGPLPPLNAFLEICFCNTVNPDPIRKTQINKRWGNLHDSNVKAHFRFLMHFLKHGIGLNIKLLCINK